MPIFTAYGISCDGCGAQYHGLAPTMTETINVARFDGWHIGTNGAALCPDCDGENE